MGDRVIITEDEPKQPDVIVVKEKAEPKTEKVVTEKTTTVVEETKH